MTDTITETELERLKTVYRAFEAWYADVKKDKKKQAYVDDNWDNLVETALEHFDSGWEDTEKSDDDEEESDDDEEESDDDEEAADDEKCFQV